MRRLYTRILVHFILVLLVVGLMSPLVFATGWRVEMLRAWTLRLAQHAAAVVAAQPDAAAREAMVRHLAKELELEVTFRDPQDRVIMSTGRERPPLRGPDAAEAREHAVFVHHGRGWAVAAPVRNRETGELFGVLITLPIRRLPPGGAWRPVLAVAVVLLVVGLATAPLARRISRPVEQLTEASRRLGRGELAYRIEVKKPRRHPPRDELDQLLVAWNDMAARVEGLVGGQRELLANVSHELRSPLARIRVALELLPEDARSSGRIADVKTDLDELEQLIEDVLTNSRLDAASLPVRREPVVLRDLLSQLAERARHDGLDVRVTGDAGSIDADAALLKRAVWNLVENAAKYGAPPIELSAVREGDRVRVSVSDAGAGIPPADRARVFEPFFRGDRARTPGAARGFGLGLTLARRVAEVHGGSIRAEASDPDHDQGCRITLDLPA